MGIEIEYPLGYASSDTLFGDTGLAREYIPGPNQKMNRIEYARTRSCFCVFPCETFSSIGL